MSRVLRGAATAVVVVLSALIAAVVAIPMIAGWIPLTVTSGSMTPTYPVGSQVVVEPLDSAAIGHIAVGDVITFMPRPNDDSLVTHRVVRVGVTDEGPVLTTRGDANNADDPTPVTGTMLRGKVRYGVPFAGYVARLVSAEDKATGRTFVAGALLAYGAVQVLLMIRDRRRRVSA